MPRASFSTQLDIFQSIIRKDVDDWGLATSGRARLNLQSRGNNFVRGRFTLDAFLMADSATNRLMPSLAINRAFIKVRFPLSEEQFFNITAGKTRLTWGDGVLFNAGDIIFGSSTRNPELTQSNIRDETAWMLVSFIPLGDFAFVETLILPPALEAALGLPTTMPAALNQATAADGIPDISDTALGARLQATVLDIKSEVGYLFRGNDKTHNPYISLQGNLLVDMYLSSSISLGPDGELVSDILDDWVISYGLLHIFDLPSDASLSVRGEVLFRPDGTWEQTRATSDSPEPPTYALNFYLETIWTPSPLLNFYLRSIISPIDGSLTIVPGVAWQAYQGLTLSFFPSFQIGEPEDTFGWESLGGVNLTAGLSFKY